MFTTKKDTAAGEKKSWYSDRYELVSIQRNFLAVITLLSLALAVVTTFSLSQIAPLKSVEPFVIQVDQKTGMTQVVDPLKAHDLTANEAVAQYFIVQYCRARETYYSTPVGTTDRNGYNYNLVRVLSTPAVYTEYRQKMALTNPDSPGIQLGADGGREIHIESIKLLDRRKASDGNDVNKYFVKAKIIEKKNGAIRNLQKLILLEFRYADLELTTEDRYLNPIGFQVVSYSIDDDNYTQ